jgi:hypothetical protein
VWILHPATASDLPLIYDLQNVPFRQQVLDSDLPPREQFIQERSAAMAEGTDKYFVLQQDQIPRGIVHLSKTSEFWQALIWGRWLHTLSYAAFVVAFEHLMLRRVVFFVRENNHRMLNICDQYQFRKIGENSVFVTLPDPPFLGTVKIQYYDLTAEEFQAKAEMMRANSMPLEFRW